MNREPAAHKIEDFSYLFSQWRPPCPSKLYAAVCHLIWLAIIPTTKCRQSCWPLSTQWTDISRPLIYSSASRATWSVIIIVISKFLQHLQMQSCGNQIIHMRKIDRQRVNIQGVRQMIRRRRWMAKCNRIIITYVYSRPMQYRKE